jgi:hypothetical protein
MPNVARRPVGNHGPIGRTLEFVEGGLRGVETFPFTETEWAAVKDAALPVVNAGLTDDPTVRASHLVGLLDILAGLRARYGDHPVLLETEADFAEDDSERVSLYRRAASIAAAHGLATLSIRLSLARVLLDLGKPEAAMAELIACQGELGEKGEPERTSWAELVAEANRVEPAGTAPDPTGREAS